MDLSKLPYAVRETLAGFDILTRSGWPAEVVVLGSAEGRELKVAPLLATFCAARE